MTDKATAKRRLTNRWNEQVELYPTMRNDIPLELYIRCNLAAVMKNNLLEQYDRAR